MRTIASFAAMAILSCIPLGVVLAQNAPDSGAAAPAAAAPAPAAPAASAPAAQTSPANPPASAAQSASPAAASPPAATASDDTPKAKKKKKAAGMTRRQEIDKSIDSGTVPSRYRSSVPREYQQYIPFSKD